MTDSPVFIVVFPDGVEYARTCMTREIPEDVSTVEERLRWIQNQHDSAIDLVVMRQTLYRDNKAWLEKYESMVRYAVVNTREGSDV